MSNNVSEAFFYSTFLRATVQTDTLISANEGMSQDVTDLFANKGMPQDADNTASRSFVRQKEWQHENIEKEIPSEI